MIEVVELLVADHRLRSAATDHGVVLMRNSLQNLAMNSQKCRSEGLMALSPSSP